MTKKIYIVILPLFVLACRVDHLILNYREDIKVEMKETKEQKENPKGQNETKFDDLAKIGNFSEIKAVIKKIEKNYLFNKNEPRINRFLCDGIERRLKIIEEQKQKLEYLRQRIDKGEIKAHDIGEIFDTRGDIEFNLRNINKIKSQIKKSKSSCYKSVEEYNQARKNETENNKKNNKEKLIASINRIINLADNEK